MKCPNCKTILQKKINFCPNCGVKVQKRRGKRIIALLLTGVLLVTILAGALLFVYRYSHAGSTENVTAQTGEHKEECIKPNPIEDIVDFPEAFQCATLGGRSNGKIMPKGNDSFVAEFTTWDWGDQGSEYPNGTCYITKLSGKFSDVEEIDDNTYTFVMDDIEETEEPGQTYISDNTRYIVEDGTQINDGDVYYLYLPGTPYSKFPQDLIDSVNNNGIHTMDEITADTYVLYHPDSNDTGNNLVFIGQMNPTPQQEPSTFNILEYALDLRKVWQTSTEYQGYTYIIDYVFKEDGKAYIGIGIYLSELIAFYSGTYTTDGNVVTITLDMDGREFQYYLDEAKLQFEQISEEGLMINHNIGTILPLTVSEFHCNASYYDDLIDHGLVDGVWYYDD